MNTNEQNTSSTLSSDYFENIIDGIMNGTIECNYKPTIIPPDTFLDSNTLAKRDDLTSDILVIGFDHTTFPLLKQWEDAMLNNTTIVSMSCFSNELYKDGSSNKLLFNFPIPYNQMLNKTLVESLLEKVQPKTIIFVGYYNAVGLEQTITIVKEYSSSNHIANIGFFYSPLHRFDKEAPDKHNRVKQLITDSFLEFHFIDMEAFYRLRNYNRFLRFPKNYLNDTLSDLIIKKISSINSVLSCGKQITNQTLPQTTSFLFSPTSISGIESK